MSDFIVRVYETEQQADSAVRNLEDAGFSSDAIIKLSPEPAAAGEEGAPKKSKPAGPLAALYAAQLEQGRSLVGVRAPFGKGLLATTALESAGPLAVELPQTPEAARASAETGDYGDGAPFSKALNLTVLKRNSPAPLSEMFGWALKSSKRFFLTSELADPHKSFTAFGPMLSDEAAPLSSKAGMKVLSDDPTPLSSKAGMKTLTDDATPLSSKFGMQVLSDDPTPLSSKTGMKVLTEHR